jgi:hypothetical protein
LYTSLTWRAAAARARKRVAYLAPEVCGYTAPAVADSLGVCSSAVYGAAQRGQATCARWDRPLATGQHETNIRKQRMTV